MSRDVRNRVVHGMMIPVLAAVFAAVILFALSRILLAVPAEIAPWVALLFAMNILVGSALAAALRGPRAFTFLAGVLIATIIAGGIAGAVVGERPIEPHPSAAAHEEEEEEPPSPVDEESPAEEATPAEEETPPEGEQPAGGEEPTVQIAAENIAFDQNEFTLPAEQPVIIEFQNLEPIPHNVAIYREQGGEEIFVGDIITDETITYEFEAPEGGSYYFQCDVHPVEMNGTVVVQ